MENIDVTEDSKTKILYTIESTLMLWLAENHVQERTFLFNRFFTVFEIY